MSSTIDLSIAEDKLQLVNLKFSPRTKLATCNFELSCCILVPHKRRGRGKGCCYFQCPPGHILIYPKYTNFVDRKSYQKATKNHRKREQSLFITLTSRFLTLYCRGCRSGRKGSLEPGHLDRTLPDSTVTQRTDSWEKVHGKWVRVDNGPLRAQCGLGELEVKISVIRLNAFFPITNSATYCELDDRRVWVSHSLVWIEDDHDMFCMCVCVVLRWILSRHLSYFQFL